jgi:ABC-type microcin C transport system duplicated ATPase subunit YejF
MSQGYFLKAKYDKLKHTKGGKRAIIAIARNLIVRVSRILLDNKPYDFKAAA